MILFLRVLERIHGHVGWLAVAALLHPAILLRSPSRRAPLSVALATAFIVVTAILGVYIYPEYRARVKQRLFIEKPAIGWLFERKEHLAVGVVAFTLVGCIAHLVAPLVDDPETKRTFAILAHRSFVVAFALCLAVATIGVVVASFKSF